ncbi:MAG: hypothetical protein OXU20_28560 [Myxococcales bacterium]|nr:hypothetical protein [Myxococcales bacterium]
MPDSTDLQATESIVDGVAAFPAPLVKSQVAQAMGLAVSDASAFMRNVSSITTAVAGVAFRQMLSDVTQAPQAQAAIQESMKAVTTATNNLRSVGEAAAQVLKDWPE